MTTRSRSVGTPAYYLGRPAAFWLAAVRRPPADGTPPHASSAGQAREQLTK